MPNTPVATVTNGGTHGCCLWVSARACVRVLARVGVCSPAQSNLAPVAAACLSHTHHTRPIAGSCDNDCGTRPNAQTSCDAGVCAYTCDANYGDCNYDQAVRHEPHTPPYPCSAFGIPPKPLRWRCGSGIHARTRARSHTRNTHTHSQCMHIAYIFHYM